ncbi:hypothetical protein BR93DRAFT_934148 [Coniochaeta sp. PMI_546]|nr:hypothetical protein BR93DRAFT_934148 [Coniochaeta sp. PMI_546]
MLDSDKPEGRGIPRHMASLPHHDLPAYPPPDPTGGDDGTLESPLHPETEQVYTPLPELPEHLIHGPEHVPLALRQTTIAGASSQHEHGATPEISPALHLPESQDAVDLPTSPGNLTSSPRHLGLYRIKSPCSVERYVNGAANSTGHIASDGHNEVVRVPTGTAKVRNGSAGPERSEIDGRPDSSSDPETDLDGQGRSGVPGFDDEPAFDPAKDDSMYTPSSGDEELGFYESSVQTQKRVITANNNTFVATLDPNPTLDSDLMDSEYLMSTAITARFPPPCASGQQKMFHTDQVTNGKRKEKSDGQDGPSPKKAKLSKTLPVFIAMNQDTNEYARNTGPEEVNGGHPSDSDTKLDADPGSAQPDEDTWYHDERASEMLLYSLTYNDLVSDVPEKERAKPQPAYMSGALPHSDNTPLALRDFYAYDIHAEVDEPRYVVSAGPESVSDQDDSDEAEDELCAGHISADLGGAATDTDTAMHDGTHVTPSPGDDDDGHRTPQPDSGPSVEKQLHETTEKERQDALSEKAAKELQAQFDAEDALRLRNETGHGTMHARPPNKWVLMHTTKLEIQGAARSGYLNEVLSAEEVDELLTAFEQALNPSLALLQDFVPSENVVQKLISEASAGHLAWFSDRTRLYAGLACLADFLFNNVPLARERTEVVDGSNGSRPGSGDLDALPQTHSTTNHSDPQHGSSAEDPELEEARLVVARTKIREAIDTGALNHTIDPQVLEGALFCLEIACQPEIHPSLANPTTMTIALRCLLHGVISNQFTEVLNPDCLAAAIRALERALRLRSVDGQQGLVVSQNHGETDVGIDGGPGSANEDRANEVDKPPSVPDQTQPSEHCTHRTAAGAQTPVLDPDLVSDALDEFKRHDKDNTLNNLLDGGSIDTALAALELAAGKESPYVFDQESLTEASADFRANHGILEELFGPVNLAIVLEVLNRAEPTVDNLSEDLNYQSKKEEEDTYCDLAFKALKFLEGEMDSLRGSIYPEALCAATVALAHVFVRASCPVPIELDHLAFALRVFRHHRTQLVLGGSHLETIIKALQWSLKSRAELASHRLEAAAASGVLCEYMYSHVQSAAMQALYNTFNPAFTITVGRNDLIQAVAAFQAATCPGDLDAVVGPWVTDVTLRALKRLVNLSAWEIVPPKTASTRRLSKEQYNALDFDSGRYIPPPPLPYKHAGSRAQASELQRGIVLNHARKWLIETGHGERAGSAWRLDAHWPIPRGRSQRHLRKSTSAERKMEVARQAEKRWLAYKQKEVEERRVDQEGQVAMNGRAAVGRLEHTPCPGALSHCPVAPLGGMDCRLSDPCRDEALARQGDGVHSQAEQRSLDAVEGPGQPKELSVVDGAQRALTALTVAEDDGQRETKCPSGVWDEQLVQGQEKTLEPILIYGQPGPIAYTVEIQEARDGKPVPPHEPRGCTDGPSTAPTPVFSSSPSAGYSPISSPTSPHGLLSGSGQQSSQPQPVSYERADTPAPSASPAHPPQKTTKAARTIRVGSKIWTQPGPTPLRTVTDADGRTRVSQPPTKANGGLKDRRKDGSLRLTAANLRAFQRETSGFPDGRYGAAGWIGEWSSRVSRTEDYSYADGDGDGDGLMDRGDEPCELGLDDAEAGDHCFTAGGGLVDRGDEPCELGLDDAEADDEDMSDASRGGLDSSGTVEGRQERPSD